MNWELSVDPELIREQARRLQRALDDVTGSESGFDNFDLNANLDPMNGGRFGFGDRRYSPTIDMVSGYYNAVYCIVSHHYGVMRMVGDTTVDALRDAAEDWERREEATKRAVERLNADLGTNAAAPASISTRLPSSFSHPTRPTPAADGAFTTYRLDRYYSRTEEPPGPDEFPFWTLRTLHHEARYDEHNVESVERILASANPTVLNWAASAWRILRKRLVDFGGMTWRIQQSVREAWNGEPAADTVAQELRRMTVNAIRMSCVAISAENVAQKSADTLSVVKSGFNHHRENLLVPGSWNNNQEAQRSLAALTEGYRTAVSLGPDKLTIEPHSTISYSDSTLIVPEFNNPGAPNYYRSPSSSDHSSADGRPEDSGTVQRHWIPSTHEGTPAGQLLPASDGEYGDGAHTDGQPVRWEIPDDGRHVANPSPGPSPGPHHVPTIGDGFAPPDLSAVHQSESGAGAWDDNGDPWRYSTGTHSAALAGLDPTAMGTSGVTPLTGIDRGIAGLDGGGSSAIGGPPSPDAPLGLGRSGADRGSAATTMPRTGTKPVGAPLTNRLADGRPSPTGQPGDRMMIPPAGAGTGTGGSKDAADRARTTWLVEDDVWEPGGYLPPAVIDAAISE